MRSYRYPYFCWLCRPTLAKILVQFFLVVGFAQAEPFEHPSTEEGALQFQTPVLEYTVESSIEARLSELTDRSEAQESGSDPALRPPPRGAFQDLERAEPVPMSLTGADQEPLESGSEERSEETADGDEIHYPYIKHSGQIQFQVNSGRLGASREGGAPTNNGLAPFDTQRNFVVRRFRPAFLFQLTPDFNIDTEFNIDPSSRQIDVLDLLMNYQLSENTSLAVGRYKVPFGWEGLRSSRTTNTIERSDATVYFYPERDIGLTVYHDTDVGEFALGTFLGQPRANGDRNGSFDIIGRASFPVHKTTKVGVSGHLGTFRPTGTSVDIPVRRFGTELQYANGPWKLEGEAFYSSGYNTASRADTKASGFYVTGVYRISEPLDLVVSYDRFDPDLDLVDRFAPNNAANSRDRKVIGLTYYVNRSPEHRFMLNYEMKRSLEGPSYHHNGFRFRYQIAW